MNERATMYSDANDIARAATAFVDALTPRTARLLFANLRNVETNSDAMRALKDALRMAQEIGAAPSVAAAPPPRNAGEKC